MTTGPTSALGATVQEDSSVHFLVWAPNAQRVVLRLSEPDGLHVTMGPLPDGYHSATVHGLPDAARYTYQLGPGTERPDPASRFQPEGVHGPSQVIAANFPWTDNNWHGLPLEDHVIYEIHVGTFTEAGTFDAVIPVLDELKELGITAIEVMPVAQFPGDRNWGYDGVYPFAVQDSYGGPSGLKRLADACHARGMAILLDVVYNHLGPEGNYFSDYGPYLTDRYHTAWGPALNFDGADSDHVRRFFIENALYWITEFHFDGLRLDAVDAIIDHSARTFLEELAEAVHERANALGRRVHTFAESALNAPKLVLPPEQGGYGHDAQWNDEFHHALHALLTGERAGYYADFGEVAQLAKAFEAGYVYSGQYSKFRRHSVGRSSRSVPAPQFVVFRQNHDQVGNRLYGRRLGQLLTIGGVKVATGAFLLSPYIPLLFMGEEYAEPAPFLYFTSHSEPGLIEAVRLGRQDEFAGFDWPEQPPDPQDVGSFLQSKLDRRIVDNEPHGSLRALYRELLRMRKSEPALRLLSKDHMEVKAFEAAKALVIRRWSGQDEVAIAFNFSRSDADIAAPLPSGTWHSLIDSSDPRWGGPGSRSTEIHSSNGGVRIDLPGYSFVVYKKLV